MNVLYEVWDRIVSEQPPPSGWIVAGTAAAAALVVLSPRTWPVARHVITIAHEGAHGLAAVLTGRRLHGVRLHSDTSGLTVSAGCPKGFGMAVTAAAGYLGPALIGLGAAGLVAAGHSVGVLWAVLALLVLLLVHIRNWFGLWSVVVTACAVFAVSWWLPEPGQSAVAYFVTWFLLLAAPRPVLELYGRRGRGKTRTSDADVLARVTFIPAIAWVGVFFTATVAALALGTRMLVA